MRTLYKLAFISTIIIVLLTVGGCGTSPTTTPAAAPAGGLEGVISDASTGEPVAGAQVTIAGQAGVFTVTTGPDGAYKADDLPAGAYLISVQATGYYVDVLQVGVVANVTSSGDVGLEPAVAAIVTATPAPTPIPTLTPTPPPVVPDVTPPPTPTPLPSPTLTPTPVPTRQASTGSAGVMAAPLHARPTLSEPRDESEFTGPRRITFRWTGSCCLAENEYYVVSIPHPLGVEEGWVKTTEWEVPDYLYLLVPESRLLTWSVSVRRHTGEYPNGQWKGPVVSHISEVWRFWWYPGGTFSSPLPRPVSPLPTPKS